jgi:hypothetical protein
MDYTIVTAWYDVREKENHPLKNDESRQFFCPMDWYFDSAKLLFNKPFPMVIYTEPRFQEYILKERPEELHPFTKFVFKDYDELLFYDKFPKYEESHNKHPIHNLTQEKFTALYKFIVNQKVNFVKETVETNPFQTSKFAWMDMRLHCVYDMPVEETTQVMNELPTNQIKLMQMTWTDPVHGRGWFYDYTRGKCAAGFFAGYAEPMLKFCELCQKEFIDALNEERTPTDEMIYSFVISHHPHLFTPYVGEYGDCLKNLVRIRNSHHLVFPYLQTCFDKGMHYHTAQLSELIRRGYKSNEFGLSADQIHKAWYFGYVANFWNQQRDVCKIILNEYFDLANIREDVKNHICGARNFLREMIQYMNDKTLIDRLDAI